MYFYAISYYTSGDPSRMNQTHHPCKSPFCCQEYMIISIGHWSVIDSCCLVNSQNWQIIQDGPAYNQCDGAHVLYVAQSIVCGNGVNTNIREVAAYVPEPEPEPL